ncbi:hypothetical protein GCK72_010902 [Caenorhabditis remanei]|uniref:Uncharacterized protein n=1 Tax=Caenorhabditis remanei TaxID=31234 RepID=A0A6A5H452_CAERE|nr:hypothetical protein GCK72_010902 [Caenorhabditis remanei]KAF1762640.1 hypothetical protein GCK72_010902 [Caenorhabditis remanei]
MAEPEPDSVLVSNLEKLVIQEKPKQTSESPPLDLIVHEKKYRDTRCGVIPCQAMRMFCDEDNIMTTWYSELANGSNLLPNFWNFWDDIRTNPTFRYFIIDSADLAKMDQVWHRCVTKAMRAERTTRLLSSIGAFTSYFRKQLYIRSIPPARCCEYAANRIFTDEVLEFLPVMMRQQGIIDFSEDDARLEKYRKMWESNNQDLYKTITPQEFEAFLDEFDVDKSKIKIIQDPVHELSRVHMIKKTGNITIFSPDGNTVIDRIQAVFFVFGATVTGINWKTEKCPMHENCRENLKKCILELMNKFFNYEKGTFIAFRMVLDSVDALKKECEFNYHTERGTSDFVLRDFDNELAMPINRYNTTIEFFDLPEYKNFCPSVDKDTIMIWQARVFYQFGWLQQFFGNENVELRDTVVNGILFLVPDHGKIITDKFLRSILNGETPYQASQTEVLAEKRRHTGYEKLRESREQRNKALKEMKKAKKAAEQTGKKTGKNRK